MRANLVSAGNVLRSWQLPVRIAMLESAMIFRQLKPQTRDRRRAYEGQREVEVINQISKPVGSHKLVETVFILPSARTHIIFICSEEQFAISSRSSKTGPKSARALYLYKPIMNFVGGNVSLTFLHLLEIRVLVSHPAVRFHLWRRMKMHPEVSRGSASVAAMW
jgi:hypothetical protein